MKPKNKKNGYVTVRIGNSTVNYYKALKSKNVQHKVIEHIQMLDQRNIDWAYVIGYPTDGEAFLGVNAKFGTDWQKDGLFPELFKEESKNTTPTERVVLV